MTTTMIHRFEQAGLGKAPFRAVGVSEHTYQAVPGDPTCPVQPGATCDYCGASIRYAYAIRSADGRKFRVGSDCVERTGDEGLRRVVDATAAKIRRDKSHARDDARIAAAIANLTIVAEAWSAQPHPVAFMAAKGKTRLDWAQWMLSHAGRSGKVEVAKMIEADAADAQRRA